MIELKQVTKQYGQTAVLKNITLTIDQPAFTACWAETAQAKQLFSNPLRGTRILRPALLKLRTG